jgi:hypothetical protein
LLLLCGLILWLLVVLWRLLPLLLLVVVLLLLLLLVLLLVRLSVPWSGYPGVPVAAVRLLLLDSRRVVASTGWWVRRCWST